MSERTLPFYPKRGANQVVTPAGTAASISLDPTSKSVRLVNSGATNVCHVRIGKGSQTATTADLVIPPSSQIIVAKGEGENTLSHISASGTTLHVQEGEGGV